MQGVIMREMWILVWAAIAMAAQFFVSLKAKRKLVKALPLLLQTLIIAACFVGYAASSYTNWAFLILGVLMLIPLLGIGAGWLFAVIFRIFSGRKNNF